MSTELETAKTKRVQYLKTKMRRQLEEAIGDGPDNIADIQRAIIMGSAISRGVVTDTAIITRYAEYITGLLADYGGADAIMDVLEYDKTALEQHVVAGYFLAKQTIREAEDEAGVMLVDLPGEPIGEME